MSSSESAVVKKLRRSNKARKTKRKHKDSQLQLKQEQRHSRQSSTEVELADTSVTSAATAAADALGDRQRCQRENKICGELDHLGTFKATEPLRRSKRRKRDVDTKHLDKENKGQARKKRRRKSTRLKSEHFDTDHEMRNELSSSVKASAQAEQQPIKKEGIDTDSKPEKRIRRSTRRSCPYFTSDSTAPIEATKEAKRSRRKKKAEQDVDDNSRAVSAKITDRQPISDDTFGLLQEVYAPDALKVIIVAMFCNQTPGSRARPYLAKLFEKYPTARLLALANQQELAEEIKPLGLHNVRARRLIQLATEWLTRPPVKGTRSPRKGIPKRMAYPDTEVSHLPGCGPYAMDSYRLFCTGDGWREVRPDDRELRPYVKWRWSKEGIDYDTLVRDTPGTR